MDRPMPAPEELESLAHRMGGDVLEARLEREALLWRRRTAPRRGWRARLASLIHPGVTAALYATGLWPHAHRSYLDVRVVTNSVRLERLPAAFDGFRLLHLSDLHADLDAGLMPVILRQLDGLSYDAVVITGDYQDDVVRGTDRAMADMRRLLDGLRKPVFGVMGNHDLLAQVAVLEQMGLQILLNESVAIERNGQRIWICGVDDPRFFKTHDFARARRDVPTAGCAIVLAHTPDVFPAAAVTGFDLFLAGHTHGGQLCLPNGSPVVRNASVPWTYCKGAWDAGHMVGYTSGGTGACGVAARLFAPAEIAVHTLVRA